MLHFTPDKYQTKDKRSNTSEKSEKKHFKTGNQPEPEITTISAFGLRPNDPVWWYHVNPKKQVNLDAVAARLGELYGVDVFVAENVFNRFDVYLTDSVKWCDVERCTKQVLSELDS